MAEIIRLMVGREVSERYPRIAHEIGELVLRVNVGPTICRPGGWAKAAGWRGARGVQSTPAPSDLDDTGRQVVGPTLDVRSGDIFGLDAVAGERIAIFGREESSASPPRRLAGQLIGNTASGIGTLTSNPDGAS